MVKSTPEHNIFQEKELAEVARRDTNTKWLFVLLLTPNPTPHIIINIIDTALNFKPLRKVQGLGTTSDWSLVLDMGLQTNVIATMSTAYFLLTNRVSRSITK